jgi:hypothetical protein
LAEPVAAIRVSIMLTPEGLEAEMNAPGDLTDAVLDLLADLGLGGTGKDDEPVKSFVSVAPEHWFDTASVIRRLDAERSFFIAVPSKTRGEPPTLKMGRRPDSWA